VYWFYICCRFCEARMKRCTSIIYVVVQYAELMIDDDLRWEARVLILYLLSFLWSISERYKWNAALRLLMGLCS
jgi:hypothetical protein